MPTQQRIILRLNAVHVFGGVMNKLYISSVRIIPVALIALCAVQAVSPAIAKSPESHSQNAAQKSEIIDIISNADGHNLSILVKLKHQPHVAATQISDNGFTLSISEMLLHQANINPPNNTYVTGVEVDSETVSHSSKLDFSTAKLKQIHTEIFKNAILISAKLATPAPASLQSASQKPQISAAAPADTKIASTQLLNQDARFKDVFKITPSYCIQAEQLLKEDAWNLEAVADRALCMVADGKQDQAKISVDQIQSFSPDNWKAALVEGEILRLQGNISQSKIQFSYAMQYVETPETKNTIANWAARD